MSDNEVKAPENCERCGDPFTKYAKTYSSGLGIPGYAVVREPQSDGSKKNTYICYKCASEDEKKHMREQGKIALYLSYNSPCNNPQFTTSGVNLTPSDYSVGDWPGLLTIKPMRVRVGKHNIARRRWDVWFAFEGYVWHGVQYGDMTQIVHCKRTKEQIGKAA